MESTFHTDDVSVENPSLSTANEKGTEATKPSSAEDREMRKTEELVEEMEIDKKEEPSLSTEKRPLNREQENASTLSSYPTTISDTAKLEAETPRKLSAIEDSDASPSSGGKLEPDPTINIYSAPTVLESDINKEISSPSQSTTTVSNMSTTSTKVESSWCSTKSGHPCAFPFSWNSYTWHRSLFPFNVLESPKQLRAFIGMSLM